MMKKTLLAVFLSTLFVVSAINCTDTHKHWGYEGSTGPAHWGSLDPTFSECALGDAQTPIDINKTYKAALDNLEFSYKKTPLKIINNGHSIQVNYGPGSTLVVDGKTYNLLQFHFHSPSENKVQGNFYDMEMHLVHKNDGNEIAVVGLFLKKGKPNSTIQAIWKNLPKKKNKEKVVKKITINVSDLLPENRAYYHFYGSLTTPPCSENVNWSILKTPVEVSEKQIKKFQSIMKHDTNRPVQPIKSRFILESQ